MLRAENICKDFTRYGDTRTVLKSTSFEIKQGEFASIIGPSGCGKTTLLRIVAGLIRPTEGKIYLDGALSMSPSLDKGFVFQHFNLFPWRTVIKNAEYGLEIAGVPSKQRRERAMEKLESFGLGDFANHFPSEISGGMKQRVALARALVLNPKVLLMDEPFGALDALTRELFQEDLLKIVEAEKRTVLFITHSIDEAIFLSDRIFAMGSQPGTIIREWTIKLLKPRYTYDFRKEAEYTATRQEIWDTLKQETRRGK